MNKIKLNCELPLDAIYMNESINDYDFILYHLYKDNKRYKQWVDSRSKRFTILDNSAYEFFIKGQELDLDGYWEAIQSIKPDVYIIPDKLMDAGWTMDSVQRWTEYDNHAGKPLAVLQGNSIKDFEDCLKLYADLGIEYIAYPFHNKFFQELGAQISIDKSIDHQYALGRFIIFQNLYSRHHDILDNMYVHLLGSHKPCEWQDYAIYDCVKSFDTAYPVKCAIEGYELGKEPEKPNIILDDFMDEKLSENTIKLIRTNVEIFRNYKRGI